jgi:hypothetical protein
MAMVIIKGTGVILSSLAIKMEMGTNIITVVTLSRKAEITAVTANIISMIRKGWALASLAVLMAIH